MAGRTCENALRMSMYKVGDAAILLGVSPDTVRRWVDAGRLSSRRTEGGRRLIDGEELARFAQEMASASATTAAPAVESARNHLAGIVTRVVRDTVMAQVEVQAGAYRVVSLISREAADELGLAPGVAVVAVVKATNVMIELAAQ